MYSIIKLLKIFLIYPSKTVLNTSEKHSAVKERDVFHLLIMELIDVERKISYLQVKLMEN